MGDGVVLSRSATFSYEMEWEKWGIVDHNQVFLLEEERRDRFMRNLHLFKLAAHSGLFPSSLQLSSPAVADLEEDRLKLKRSFEHARALWETLELASQTVGEDETAQVFIDMLREKKRRSLRLGNSDDGPSFPWQKTRTEPVLQRGRNRPPSCQSPRSWGQGRNGNTPYGKRSIQNGQSVGVASQKREEPAVKQEQGVLVDDEKEKDVDEDELVALDQDVEEEEEEEEEVSKEEEPTVGKEGGDEEEVVESEEDGGGVEEPTVDDGVVEDKELEPTEEGEKGEAVQVNLEFSQEDEGEPTVCPEEGGTEVCGAEVSDEGEENIVVSVADQPEELQLEVEEEVDVVGSVHDDATRPLDFLEKGGVVEPVVDSVKVDDAEGVDKVSEDKINDEVAVVVKEKPKEKDSSDVPEQEVEKESKEKPQSQLKKLGSVQKIKYRDKDVKQKVKQKIKEREKAGDLSVKSNLSHSQVAFTTKKLKKKTQKEEKSKRAKLRKRSNTEVYSNKVKAERLGKERAVTRANFANVTSESFHEYSRPVGQRLVGAVPTKKSASYIQAPAIEKTKPDDLSFSLGSRDGGVKENFLKRLKRKTTPKTSLKILEDIEDKLEEKGIQRTKRKFTPVFSLPQLFNKKNQPKTDEDVEEQHRTVSSEDSYDSVVLENLEEEELMGGSICAALNSSEEEELIFTENDDCVFVQPYGVKKKCARSMSVSPSVDNNEEGDLYQFLKEFENNLRQSSPKAPTSFRLKNECRETLSHSTETFFEMMKMGVLSMNLHTDDRSGGDNTHHTPSANDNPFCAPHSRGSINFYEQISKGVGSMSWGSGSSPLKLDPNNKLDVSEHTDDDDKPNHNPITPKPTTKKSSNTTSNQNSNNNTNNTESIKQSGHKRGKTKFVYRQKQTKEHQQTAQQQQQQEKEKEKEKEKEGHKVQMYQEKERDKEREVEAIQKDFLLRDKGVRRRLEEFANNPPPHQELAFGVTEIRRRFLSGEVLTAVVYKNLSLLSLGTDQPLACSSDHNANTRRSSSVSVFDVQFYHPRSPKWWTRKLCFDSPRDRDAVESQFPYVLWHPPAYDVVGCVSGHRRFIKHLTVAHVSSIVVNERLLYGDLFFVFDFLLRFQDDGSIFHLATGEKVGYLLLS